MDLARFRRRVFVSPLLFLVGAFFAARTGFAATGPASSDDFVKLALEAVLALVGLVGSVVTMLSGLLRKREGLARHALVAKVNELEGRVKDSEERAAEDRKSSDERFEQIRTDMAADRRERHEDIIALRRDLSWNTQAIVDARDLSQQVLRLLQDKSGG